METSRGLEHKAFMENSNFLMVHLRDDLVSGDLMHSMGISNVLYVTKLLVSTCLKINDHKLQGISSFAPLMVGNFNFFIMHFRDVIV